MPYDPRIHHRRSIRLKDYDYSLDGAYFVTICTQNRAMLFGSVAGCEMRPNEAGTLIQRTWDELPGHYPDVETDAFQLMPNHLHGIVVLSPSEDADENQDSCRTSLFDLMRSFKSLTTTLYGTGVRENRWPRYDGKLW